MDLPPQQPSECQIQFKKEHDVFMNNAFGKFERKPDGTIKRRKVLKAPRSGVEKHRPQGPIVDFPPNLTDDEKIELWRQHYLQSPNAPPKRVFDSHSTPTEFFSGCPPTPFVTKVREDEKKESRKHFLEEDTIVCRYWPLISDLNEIPGPVIPLSNEMTIEEQPMDGMEEENDF